MTYYEITCDIQYRDEDGKELTALTIYKGCPIFHDTETGEYFWIADTGKLTFWTTLAHAKAGLGSYQAHNHTREWLNHEKSARVMA